MTSAKGIAAFAAAGTLLFLDPVRSFAATTAGCTPPPSVPESPMGPAALILVALGFVAYRRRRSGLTAAVATTLAVVVCASLMGTVLAAAATSSCPGGGSTSPGGQGVLGTSTSDPASTSISTSTSTSTPLTGADIPWITASILIVSGAGFVATSPIRRHRSRGG